MSILSETKNLGINQNVYIRVIDEKTGKVVQQHVGHNSATNTLIYGIAKYLAGYGTLNQAENFLTQNIPHYMSLGTMGLYSQKADSEGLPLGIGGESTEDKVIRYKKYMTEVPGFSADQSSLADTNNGRPYYGLGPKFENRPDPNKTVDCELISDIFPRTFITYREIVPATYTNGKTIDVIYSAMLSTGALKDFRQGNNYLFITEAGLWSNKTFIDGADNSLLAGYRIAPSGFNKDTDFTNSEEGLANRTKLESSILRVGLNQVVQVIWKLEIGSIDDFSSSITPLPDVLRWITV